MTPAMWATMSILCAAGSVTLAVWSYRARLQVERTAQRLQEDTEIASLARTCQLVVTGADDKPKGGVQVAFALYAAAARSPFKVGPGVHIQYGGPPIIGKPDKPRNIPLR
jgi:hypothetical protein